MSFQAAVFYVFAAILLLAALRVITARNPVHATLSLVLAFATAAGLWMLLEAEFLAIALVLVYIGAVMVLFLFVVMMLDINLDRLREGYWDYLVPGLAVAHEMRAAGWEVVWLGARGGMEERLVPQRGYRTAWIRLSRSSAAESVSSFLQKQKRTLVRPDVGLR